MKVWASSESSSSSKRDGFTLVELLAVMAILGLLVGLSLAGVNHFRQVGYETACQSNLRNIASTMTAYADARSDGRWPAQRGAKFLLQMVRDDFVTDKELKMFLCPATEDRLERSEGDTPYSGVKKFDEIDPDCISYAGRDNTGQQRLQKDRMSEEPIASDDNWFAGAGRANHSGVTFVVFGDTHVDKILLSKYKSELPEKQTWIPVGPTSPDPDLRKLSVE